MIRGPSAGDAPGSPALFALPSSLWDLVLVAVATGAAFAAAAALDLHELFAGWVSVYEHWQVDELPATLLVLAASLAWFAFRRWREARSEVARRRAVEVQVRELLERNRDLAQRLIQVQEAERRALARELHDELGQTCNGIRVEAAYIMNLAEGDKEAAAASARRIADAAEALYLLVRDMLRRLRPAVLDDLGLLPALQELCESWEERTGIACSFVPQGLAEDFAPDDASAIALYRVVQEGLTNVLRHAAASRVRIALRLAEEGRRLRLTLEDDGRGMDQARPSEGLGLLGMRERIAGLGGELAIESAPGQGVRLTVALPC